MKNWDHPTPPKNLEEPPPHENLEEPPSPSPGGDQTTPPPLWTEWMTDACKNITLAKTSFRPAIICEILNARSCSLRTSNYLKACLRLFQISVTNLFSNLMLTVFILLIIFTLGQNSFHKRYSLQKTFVVSILYHFKNPGRNSLQGFHAPIKTKIPMFSLCS